MLRVERGGCGLLHEAGFAAALAVRFPRPARPFLRRPFGGPAPRERDDLRDRDPRARPGVHSRVCRRALRDVIYVEVEQELTGVGTPPRLAVPGDRAPLKKPETTSCPTENDIGSNVEAYFPRMMT